MPGLLEGHIALVTGGGSGIGRGIAKAYAEQGATVIIADINLAGAQETVAQIGGNSARAEALDVTDRSACDALAQKVKSEVGNLSILVNNAGIVRCATLDKDSSLWIVTPGSVLEPFCSTTICASAGGAPGVVPPPETIIGTFNFRRSASAVPTR